ncbi:MAG: asparagine synthase-related protein [Steroidobacteraceae bacterium]
MPGVVGLIGRGSPDENGAIVARMAQRMLHEPFYRSGTYANEALGAYVGWVARAGSFSDCMPIWNDAADICLVLTGENYADPPEVARLAPSNQPVDANDARYLIRVYEALGDGWLARLNGYFSGVILDLRRKQSLLFNDRYGLSRIYLHDAGDRLYFASEAKALLAVLPGLRSLDPDSVAEFLSCGCALQGRTLFKGVVQLPAASKWTFRPNQVAERARYFGPEQWTEQEALSPAAYYEALEQTFQRILPRYMASKQQVAVSLTGGVDSRMVMAWARRPPGSLPTYTFGGMFRECADVKIARRVAAACGQSHQVIPVAQEFLAEFPALAERTVYLTDGAMDVSGSPDLFVNRIARTIAPVRLTGNYGGEILRRIVAFKPMALCTGVFARDFSDAIAAANTRYARELSENKLAFVAFKQVPWHHHSRLALELSQLSLRTPYLDNELVALSFRAPPELATSNDLALRLIADGNAELGRIGTDRGVLHRSIPLLTKVDNFFQEFSFKAEYAYDYGMPQWLARLDRNLRALHLERAFLGRHKFYHFRYWYRFALAPFVCEVLLDTRSRGRPYLDGSVLERLVLRHVEGRGNFTLEIHRLLSLELLQRTLIDATH